MSLNSSRSKVTALFKVIKLIKKKMFVDWFADKGATIGFVVKMADKSLCNMSREIGTR